MAGIDVEKSFHVADDPVSLCYFQQISARKDVHIFHATWGGCIIKNCDDNGELLEFKIKSEYDDFQKESKRKLWLYMKLKVFRLNRLDLYAVFCCPECEVTSGTLELAVQQEPGVIGQRLCLHSRVASSVLGNWRNIWDVSLSPSDQVFNVCLNQDTICETFIPSDSNNGLLSAVFHNRKISLLFCVAPRQEVPYCSNCVRRKCIHFTILKNDQTRRNDNQLDEETEQYQPKHDMEEEAFGHDDNYMKVLPNHIRGYLYGYNYTPIVYPFRDSPEQQRVWFERMSGQVNIPDKLVPVFDTNLKCKHNIQYNCDEISLVKESQNLCLFTELGDRIFPSPVLARPTVGPCTCLQRYDGHPLLIWNLGKGRFMDYTVLHSYLHRWRTCGMSMLALCRSIVDGAQSCGISCTLTYKDIHRSVCGFFSNLVFNIEKAFSCPNHGSSPKWIVSDGKSLGPLKRKVKHLTELDVASDDNKVLSQSTSYKDRILLAVKKERVLLCKLVTGDITVEDFLSSSDITSDNGLLVRDLVRHIGVKFPQKIPYPYVLLLTNVSKNSSTRSLLQTNTLEPLDYLSQFCKEDLDLRVVENGRELKSVKKCFPALWPILEEICSTEKSNFLPREVSEIVLKMLAIRNETFHNAAKRSNTDYFLWTDPIKEHPTQCYPMLPLWRHPSKYTVSKQADTDLCDKTFTYHDDFCAGIYSVGCACPANITLGFEIMLVKESPRNLFRFLMTRDVDMGRLEGILVDHACIFEPYTMNREAGMLEKVLVLVDGAHWSGQKKLKKFDKQGKGGHLGYNHIMNQLHRTNTFLIFRCSEGYNFNIYKKVLDEKINSQGREQLHSLIEKCSASLRLMSYRHFMIFMRVFFATTNLFNRNYN